MSKNQRWANRDEAMAYAKAAEQSGNMGMRYISACDYLGWDVSIRRLILAKRKSKAHLHTKWISFLNSFFKGVIYGRFKYLSIQWCRSI